MTLPSILRKARGGHETSHRTGDTITFRSGPSFYYAEESGDKPCTVRILGCDESMDILRAWTQGKLKLIRLQATDRQAGFFRELTFVARVGEVVAKSVLIFCWRHKETP